MPVTITKASKKEENDKKVITTTISLTRKQHSLLRHAALAYAEKEGGRNAVSRVVQILIEANREKLEKGQL